MNTIKKNVISFVLVMALVLTSVTVMPVSGATNVTTISNLKFAKNHDGSCTITWNKLDGGSYNIYKASSRFAKYEKVEHLLIQVTMTKIIMVNITRFHL